MMGNQKLWKVPPVLSRHIFTYGTIGSGKSAKNLAITQQYYELKYKIWDIYGGKRNEGSFWALPNDDIHLWSITEKETHEFKVPGPKKYNVNLIYPCFLSTMPKRLPQSNDGRVKSKIFTIPIKDLNLDDIRCAIGEVTSNNTIYFWETLYENMDKNSTSQDIEFIIDNFIKKKKKEDSPIRSIALYRIFLNSLKNEGLLSNKNFDLNLDVIEEGRNKETITVLCLDYVPERFKYFIMRYVLRKIDDGLKSDEFHKKHIALCREASDFMKLENTTEDRNSPIPIFRNFINRLVRYGRDGIHLIMDTQSSKEVRGLIEGVEDLLIACEMPSASDREAAFEQIRKDSRMTSAQFHALATLKIHEMCVVEKGQRARILRRVFPPRSRYWKEGKGNFYTIWAREVDQWRNTGEDIDKIENMILESKKRIALKQVTMNVEYVPEIEEKEEEFQDIKEVISPESTNPTALIEEHPKQVTTNILLNEEYHKSLEKKKYYDEIRRRNKELIETQKL